MIIPEVSMPVLYHPHIDDHLGHLPLAATIARVWELGMINISIVDSNGLVQNRTSVPLYQGIGNVNELYGVHGRFCEFPAWFIKLMAPQFFTGLHITTAAAPLVPSPFEVHCVAFGAPAGTPDLVRCEHGADARIATCGCVPTSQVLG